MQFVTFTRYVEGDDRRNILYINPLQVASIEPLNRADLARLFTNVGDYVVAETPARAKTKIEAALNG